LNTRTSSISTIVPQIASSGLKADSDPMADGVPTVLSIRS
jgi:hypothetical protein